MATPPVRPKVPLPALLTGFATLPDQDAAARLTQLFTQRLYKFAPPPCPTYAGTDPFQPVSGQPLTYFFSPGPVPFEYTLLVMNVTDDPPTVAWLGTQVFNAPPYQFVVPGSVFANDNEYLFVLYPSVNYNGVPIPLGCTSSVVKTVSQQTDEVKLAALAAAELYTDRH